MVKEKASQPYGIGIVGLGMIAQFHAKAIADMADAKLVACYSRSQDKADAFATQHPCDAYSNYDDFLANPELDIVAIATPSGYHLEPIEAAAAAGKHILCEKPIEATVARTDAALAACQKHGVKICGIFPRRFTPAVEATKKAVDAGRLGQLTLASAYIKWFRTQEYYDADIWRRIWSLSGGGALMNQSIHTIDMLLHFAGDVESVSAYMKTATHQGIEVEDLAVATLKFKNGALGTIEGTTTAYSKTGHPAQVQLCGSTGSIFLTDETLTVWDFETELPEDAEILAKYGANAPKGGAGAADPGSIDYRQHLRNFQEFTAALTEGREPTLDGPESRRAIALIEAIYTSARQDGKPVTL
ncbi:Gfo/Idh/MocA family oxidoreductase [Pelagicoccus sp. SDUM812005]|uniref:Gfo/Idh/MocA family protein n=1 Tax=Pelagicoccus sp. SDUM812005 TaxID=3041257 RepID=UPI00280DAE51|nr:Gfo/Idh/MocA family oxidoreductase [Pelagicoccus sp. SDUM812005]MDQ8183637.1 Gfo/Idh/MocA family oxidoreductase [Pelagicoccus sp. SDUM812005]